MTAPVVMYSTAVCPYCQRAEMLLKARGVTEIEKIRIDLDPARKDEMIEKTGRRTVPQIFIGATHVGGFDDLSALDRDGKLTRAGRLAAGDFNPRAAGRRVATNWIQDGRQQHRRARGRQWPGVSTAAHLPEGRLARTAECAAHLPRPGSAASRRSA
jgi:glutaredoxin 3